MESLRPNIYFPWMKSNLDPRLKVDETGARVTCTSSIGPFKNAFGNYPLLPCGVYFWEFQIKKGCHFKIGIADLTKYPFEGSFSDGDFGFSYYSMGELRHKNNTQGPTYGKGYGIGDIVGVLCDRFKEEVSFFCNGEDLGVAFKIKQKENIFYPAVACLIKEEAIAIHLPLRED